MKNLLAWFDELPRWQRACLVGFGGLFAILSLVALTFHLLGSWAVWLWVFLIAGGGISGVIYEELL